MSRRGALSEYSMYNHLKNIDSLQEVNSVPDTESFDFYINYSNSIYRMEHKRARNTPYRNGDLKVELQKSRDSGNNKKNRFYKKNQFDIVSVDVSEHTHVENDFRFAHVGTLQCAMEFPDCVKKYQRLNLSDFTVWKKDLMSILSSVG